MREHNNRGVWFVVAALVIGTMINHLITVYSPYKKYERWAKNRWFFLERESKVLVDKYKTQGIDLRFNIMTPKISLLNWIEPFKIKGREFRKPRLFSKVFAVIWSSGNYGVNKQLRITTNQGVCGRAFNSADLVYGTHFLDNHKPTFKFNKEQMELTGRLVIVASFRIMEEANTPESKSNKVIGVLNAESDTRGSEILITDPIKQKELYEELVAFSLVCNKLV